MVYSGTDKHNVSRSLTHNASKRFQATGRFYYTQMKVYGMGTSDDNTRFNKMEHILQYRPTVGIYGNDSDLLVGEDPLLEDDQSNPMQSPLVSAAEETKDKLQRILQINGGFTFKFSKRFSFRNSMGVRYNNIRQDIFYGKNSINGKRSSINGSIQYNESGNFQTSNVLTYDYKTKKQKLIFMVGQEWVSNWSKYVRSSAKDFPNNDIGLDDMNLGTPSSIHSGVNFDDKLISFFGRANYNFGEKYLLTATIRTDGSSKFSANNKWGFFPSISAAWRIGEEEFIKKLGIFSDLKFRIGYGLAGNNRIGSYNSLAILESITIASGDGTASGYAPAQIPNPDLKWEANKTFNLGMDFGFFNQRLTISPEFYINKSSNLLLSAELPYSSGFQTMVINAGETKNTGVDLTINSANISTKDFTWNTALTLSHNKNKIEALTGEAEQLYEAKFGFNLNTHRLAVGAPIGQFYGLVCNGIDENGRYIMVDKDGDGEISDPADYDYIGSAQPKLTYGITNTFRYKNFDLSFFLRGTIGNDILNATRMAYAQSGFLPGTNALDDPLTYTLSETPRFSNYYLEKGSFMRLDNLTLGYKIKALNGIRVYFTAQNLFVITKYKGLDPEVPMDSGDGLTPGVEPREFYPKARTFSVGLNLNF